MPDPIHAHCFLPGTDTVGGPLVLLHGSGGNEFDLMSLASELAPKAARLGIRGTVAMEEGMQRHINGVLRYYMETNLMQEAYAELATQIGEHAPPAVIGP